MHDLAKIETITNIRPIEGKDRIVLATVANYDTIIAKEEFKEGDKCIYCYYDSILPLINPATKKPDFEFLRKRCYSDKYQGFRIRPMKMGGVVSEGLVLPLSVLPGSEKMKIGTVVTDKLGIRLYDPEADVEVKTNQNKLRKALCRYKVFRNFFIWLDIKTGKKKISGLYPQWITKSDEENIESCYNKVAIYPDTSYVLTEKIEGMATTYSIDEKGKFAVYSHNFKVNEGSWFEYARINEVEKKLKEVCRVLGVKGIAIQGELIGPGIQKNIYGRSHFELYLYGGYHLDHSKLTWEELLKISDIMGIATAPFIREDKIKGLEEMLKDCEGWSVLENPVTNKPVDREGLVYRTEDGNIHFKCKSRSYKLAWEKKITD